MLSRRWRSNVRGVTKVVMKERLAGRKLKLKEKVAVPRRDSFITSSRRLSLLLVSTASLRRVPMPPSKKEKATPSHDEMLRALVKANSEHS